MKRIAVACFLIFAVLPLAAGLVYALLYSLGIIGALSEGFTLSAWISALSDTSLWISLGLSLLVAVCVVGLSTLLALLLLLWLRPQLDQPRMRFLLHFPLALPPIVAAFISFQWLGSSGMLARMEYRAGWIGQPDDFTPLINDPLYIGVIATLVLMTMPVFVLIFLSHYKSSNLLEISNIAATLGASSRSVYRRVVIPVLLYRTAPTLLLYGIFIFGAFEVPLLLGRQHPAMISMFINQKFRRFNLADLPVAYMATVLYALLILLLLVVFWRKKGGIMEEGAS